MKHCPQCGNDTAELIEGYCDLCWNSNQLELDLHNARHDWWAGLSDSERSNQIKQAMK